MEFLAVVKGLDDITRLQTQIKQLTGAVGLWIQKMQAANAAGNVAVFNKLANAATDAKKKIQELEAELGRLNSKMAASGGGLKGSQGILQASYALDDLQYGIKGIVNNIAPLVSAFGGAAGVAGAAGIAAVAINVLYNHMDQLEKLWGQTKVKSEAEQIKMLGDQLARTAEQAERYYKLKKKHDDEEASRTAFQAEKNKGTEGQELGAQGLSGRVAQRGDLRTGQTGADKLAEILGGGLKPHQAPGFVGVEASTIQKLTEQSQKIVDADEQIKNMLANQAVGKALGLRNEEGEKQIISVQQRKKALAEGEQKKIFDEEVRPKIAAFLGTLFNTPGTEDYKKVQEFLEGYLKTVGAAAAGGGITPAMAKAETDFVTGILEDMSKTTPEAMKKLAADDVKRKMSEMDAKIDEKIEELINLVPDALDDNVRKTVANFKQKMRKEPANQAGLKEVERAAKEADDALGGRTKEIKGVQEERNLEKQFKDRLAQFEKAVTDLEEAGPGAMTANLAQIAAQARDRFENTPHTKFTFKDVDDALDDVQRALLARKEEFARELRRSNERIRKTREKIADVPGFDRDLQDDASDRLKMGENKRAKARAAAVREAQRRIFNLPGAPADMAESKKLAEEKIADAEKKAQQEQWFGAGKRVKEKMPGMDERIQRFEGRSLLQGYSQEQIRKQLLPQIAGQVKKEGGKGMTDKEATRQAAQILDDAMKGFGQKLVNESQQQEQQQQKGSPAILGIKEYAAKLQTEAGGGDVQKKQLTVQEQILQAILKQRPDVLQQVAGARFN